MEHKRKYRWVGRSGAGSHREEFLEDGLRGPQSVHLWKERILLYSRYCCKPQEYAMVGSTAAVAILTPNRIVVANCGDSHAVLCRAGKPIPLSVDHKVGSSSSSTNLVLLLLLLFFYVRLQDMTHHTLCVVSIGPQSNLTWIKKIN